MKHYDEDQLLEIFGGKNKETPPYELMQQYFTKEQLKGFELCKKPGEGPTQKNNQQTEQTEQSEQSSSWSSWSFGLL